MKIIINESAEKAIVQYLMNEELTSIKVNKVKQYLDSHFIQADKDTVDKYGDATKQKIVLCLDSKKQPNGKYLSMDDLFDKLQYRFQTLYTDTKERDELLKKVRDAWYDKRISKNGTVMNR